MQYMPVFDIAIVEDDASTRAFLAASVEASAQLRLAASFATRREAIDWLRAPGRGPDVLLVDLGLPDGSGIDVIRCACEVHPDCDCLVVSMFGDDESVLASIQAGAVGYLHKDSTPEDIAQTILQMRSGASPISPMIARGVLSRLRGLAPEPAAAPPVPPAPPAPPADPATALSPREQQVLELVSRGFAYAEIGRLHGVSVHTVQAQIKSIYRKLAVRSGREAVFEARQRGLLR
jgi:DNA-binding NarL/FixJ family response regulator